MRTNKRIVNIIPNKKPASEETALSLKQLFNDRGFLTPSRYDNEAELNICIGGDGAFLKAIHRYHYPTIPFVGINTGHLGFFQEIVPEEIEQFLEKYLLREYKIEAMSMVEASVCSGGSCFSLTGLNEIVIKGNKSKVIHMDILIDNNFLENFSGDGIIVATPVGSTAYNYSTGGSIIYPTIESLQLTPLSPISSKAFRSLRNSAVIPGDMPISIHPECKHSNSVLIVIDGEEFIYKNITEIIMRISEKKIYRLSFNKDSYWKNLRDKFL